MHNNLTGIIHSVSKLMANCTYCLNICYNKTVQLPNFSLGLFCEIIPCMAGFAKNIFGLLLLQPFYGSLDFVQDYLGEPVPERQKPKPILISWSKRQWVAVVSAGPYANLHHASTPPLIVYSLDALPSAQSTASKQWWQNVSLEMTRKGFLHTRCCSYCLYSVKAVN